jgi:hypothetical protein
MTFPHPNGRGWFRWQYKQVFDAPSRIRHVNVDPVCALLERTDEVDARVKARGSVVAVAALEQLFPG